MGSLSILATSVFENIVSMNCTPVHCINVIFQKKLLILCRYLWSFMLKFDPSGAS